MVEEGPARPKKDSKKQAADGAVLATSSDLPRTEESLEDEDEEDEVSDEDEDEEEEKFDIDDSSTAAASAVPSSSDLVAMQKAHEEGDKEARHAAMAIKGNMVFSAAQSHDGIETPDRFVGAHPHPPRLSPRHVNFEIGSSNGASPAPPHIHNIPATAASSAESLVLGHAAERGDRDHIHTPQLLSGGRSRIPRDRDVEAESMNVKTPTAADAPMMHRSTSAAIAGGAGGTHGAGLAASGKKGHVRGSSRDDCFARRAFAVWGQDESDSAASDNDS